MRLEHLTWPQAEAYFKTHDTVILPIGSIECHGRHMPLGTDALIPARLLELLEPQCPDTLIAPLLPYGACDSQTDFPGTISLGHDVLYQVLTKITQHLYNAGARHFVVLNGHGGNIPILDRVALDLQKQGCLLAQINWWRMVWDLNPAWTGGHGGGEETAAILAIDPNLVDRAAIADMELKPVSDELPASGFSTVKFEGVDIPVPRRVTDVTDNGWIGPDHPALATEQWGQEMLQAAADFTARFVKAFEKAPLK